jgi:hypothetical protein
MTCRLLPIAMPRGTLIKSPPNPTATRATAVASLVGVLKDQDADGLMLDFEGTYEWSSVLAPQLLGWFAELRAGLKVRAHTDIVADGLLNCVLSQAAGLHDATLSLPQGMYKPTYGRFPCSYGCTVITAAGARLGLFP